MTTTTIIIREEASSDRDAIRSVHEQAFGRAAEANLVDDLRTAKKSPISLVALVGEQLVGHILFSPVTIIADCKRLPAVALTPMAVLPEFQRRGIGKQLVTKGVKACKDEGYESVFVLGHANSTFYEQFGFAPARTFNIRSEYDIPDDLFMVLELCKKALSGCDGVVQYVPEFSTL